ncbi:GrpB family protein [Microbacterium sp. LCT-H2]|uniref:GrpB family protein n=1 Tax=Microbacterium sp. LCT-H2 TaxID=1914306 RepID=UPI0009F34ADB|nr:GrpB family protein [Microbacterium sp. LCT-H2]
MLLVPSDPSWPLRFEEFATRIRAAGEDGWIIEHIGSTAIPGMSAKPIIDLAVRVETRERLDARLPELEAAGGASDMSRSSTTLRGRQRTGCPPATRERPPSSRRS